MNRTKYYLAVLILIMSILGGSTIALASVVTGAKYYGIIQVTNNSTGTLTNASVNLSLNSPQLVAQGFATSNFSNIAIQNGSGADVAFMPGYSTSPWVLAVPTISPNQSLNDIFYCDNASGGAIKYFPGSTGMSIPYSASMNPSNNFTMESNPNVDTSVSDNIVNKTNAITVASGGGNVTVGIPFLPDHFTTDLYTDVNPPLISVNTTTHRLTYDAQYSAVDTRTYRDLSAVDDTSWILNFTFNNTSSAGAAPLVIFGYFSALANPNGYGGDGIVFDLQVNGGVLQAYLARWDGGASASSGFINLVNGTTYYATLQRNTAILATLSIYTDSARTTHVAGSPVTLAIPATVINLRYLQASNYNNGAGAGIEIIGWITDVFGTYISTAVASGEHDVKVAYVPNILTNSSFESGTAGWSKAGAGSTWGQDSAKAYSGTYSVNLTRNGTNCYIYQTFPALPGEVFSQTVAVWASVAGAVQVRLADGAHPWIVGDAHPGDSAWHLLKVTGTVGAGAAEMTLAIYIETTDTTAWIDAAYGVAGNPNLPDYTPAPPSYNTFHLYSDNVDLAYTYTEVSVPTLTNAWQVGSLATLYMGNPIFKEIVNGTTVCDIENWEYSTTFHDTTANHNDGTPTFRTTSSNANLTATMVSFGPVSQAQASVTSGTTGNVLTSDPTMPSQMYTELDFTKVPAADFINALLAASGTPQALWWFPFIFMVNIIVGLMLYGATATRGQGSLLTMCVVCDLGLAVPGVMGVIPLFACIIAWIPFGALILSQKHWGWG